MAALREAWHLWKRFGQALGDLVARVVLTLFYFSVLAPFGLGVRLRGDPLRIRQAACRWLERKTLDLTLDDARRLS